MTLEELARRYHALEAVDKSDFRRKARILQSFWREEQSLPIGQHTGRNGPRPLGSRLEMPKAQKHLWNFLSDPIKDVVRAEVLDPKRSKGKLFAKPRIFDDLLSSQPLCFNLFGELQRDLKLATRVMSGISCGRIDKVTAIQFEHSPERGATRYTGDSSAFDVCVEYHTSAGGKGFVGIEVKYHENLVGKPASHKARYDSIAQAMGCFKESSKHRLTQQPLQQLWRDHLLAGAVRDVDGYDDGYFLLLHPGVNPHCAAAVESYRTCLTRSDTFEAMTLESLVTEIRKHTSADWVDRLWDRYFDFGKVDRLLACPNG